MISRTNLAIVQEALRNTVSIKSSIEARLTAGWSTAKVFRIKAKFETPTAKADSNNSEMDYVIKLGTMSELTHASQIYAQLSESAKHLFVRHQRDLNQGTIGEEGLHFVIMEFMSEHKELANLVRQNIPGDRTAHFNSRKLHDVVIRAIDLIQSLHRADFTLNPVFKPSKELRIKIAELFESENEIAKKARLLRNMVELGKDLETNDGIYKIKPSGKTIIKLLNNHGTLTVNRPDSRKEDRYRLVHGDCHGYNIMLDNELKEGRFIDIADVHVDDYLEDYADLCVHLCFSINLETIGDRNLKNRLHFQNDPRLCINLDELYPEKMEAVGQIWKEIIDAAQKEADTISDRDWKVRLCILIGRRLLFVASKLPSIFQSYILFIQGVFLLQQVSDRLPKIRRENEKKIFVPPGDVLSIHL